MHIAADELIEFGGIEGSAQALARPTCVSVLGPTQRVHDRMVQRQAPILNIVFERILHDRAQPVHLLVKHESPQDSHL